MRLTPVELFFVAPRTRSGIVGPAWNYQFSHQTGVGDPMQHVIGWLCRAKLCCDLLTCQGPQGYSVGESAGWIVHPCVG